MWRISSAYLYVEGLSSSKSISFQSKYLYNSGAAKKKRKTLTSTWLKLLYF